MQNVILAIHLILVLALIVAILFQRSEGGALGIGGGGGMMTARGATTALQKITWWLMVGFICTSITMAILAKREAATSSVFDQVEQAVEGGITPPASDLDILQPAPEETTGIDPAVPPSLAD